MNSAIDLSKLVERGAKEILSPVALSLHRLIY